MQTNIQAPRRHPAQSMVEFALITPLLFLFILGIIEMGYALFVYTEVQNAAREGARAAAVRPCPSESDTTAIQDATRLRMPALVDTSTINPGIAYSTAKPDFGTAVTVTVHYSFQLLDPLTQSFIPHVNIHAVASRSITTGCGSTVPTVPTLTPTNASTPAATSTPTATATPCNNGNGNGNGNGNCGASPTPSSTPIPTSTPTNTPTATDTPTPTCKNNGQCK